MVYLEQESNTQIYGDVQTNKVSFKEENMDFIMSILSSNLYSNPIGSLIREYVSNAEDSHKEAGNDDPIIVTLDKNEYDDNFFFSVQDFGVGISPERFEDVFINLASSTKRESNTYIGMWGLGRLSGLSYSSQINITSIYNGTKTYYLMYKDGNKIFIDDLGSEDTEDRNGVTITVPVNKDDLDFFAREIVKQLSFFEKVYVKTCGYEYFSFKEAEALDKYKMSKIKYYDTFALNTFYPNIDGDNKTFIQRSNISPKVLLGNVVYPIKFDLIKLPDYMHINENIFIRFAIGELEVTPNREDILYSKKNVEAINKRLVEVQEEKLKVFKNIYDKEIDNIQEYYAYIYSDNLFLTVLKPEDRRCYDLSLFFGKKISFKYHGVDYKKTKELKNSFEDTVHLFYDVNMFYQHQDIDEGKISNLWRKRDNEFILDSIKNLIICDFTSLNNRAKRYFRDEVLPDSSYYHTLTQPDKKVWIKRIARNIRDFEPKKNLNRKLLKIFMGEFLERIKEIRTFNNDSVPNDYILPTKKGTSRDFDKENVLFNYIKISKSDPASTSLSPYSCNPKEINRFTIYASKEDDKKIRALCHFMYKQVRYTSSTRYSSNIHFCTVAPGKIKYLQDNSNLISLEDFMKTDTPYLRGLATIEYLNREYPMLENICRITNLGVISTDLLNVQQEFNAFIWKYDYFKKLIRYSDEQKELMNEIYEVCKENNWFDNGMKDYFDKYSKLIKGAEILLIFLNNSATIPESMVNLIIDYVTTKDLFDVSEEAKKKLKRETIFNIKK